ncbi:hypothetical protein [Streptomyces sp. NBC_01373]|uniref:hypothetical protein n=1 Tax=Streptomyces sp. NBC_01373 TaxID=2903843 RepID=UPI0022557835|nr:hypothetical protein [Streptomyces sp. NBC_01373]MCX4703932.1 hypothetical protein [Streptomyces sp. NBC_01373]
MATSSQTRITGQLSAATALVQLLTEHPELPEGAWSIGSIIPDLHGTVYGGMAALAAYAAALGGSVRAAADTFELRGQRMRRHVLRTVWRDVPVEVAVVLPAAQAVTL